MVDTLIERIGKFILTAFAIFMLYSITLSISIYLPNIVGIEKNTLSELVIIILFTSVISFIVTLLLHMIFQKVKFFDETRFLRNFHGTHQIYIYVSGLICIIGLFEPILIREKVLIEPLPTSLLPAFGLVFFIVLSNYGIYNSLVLNNDLIIFEKAEKLILGLKEILFILSVIFVFIGFIRYLFLKDDIAILIIMISSAPWIIKDIFYRAST